MTTQHYVLIIIKIIPSSGAARFLQLAIPFAFLFLATACASTTAEYHENLTAPPAAEYHENLTAPPAEPKVVLRPGDEIELKFPHWQELNDTQVIRPDGLITLQLIDSVQTRGLTPEELDEKLTKLYAPKIKDPVISVVVRSLVDQRIYVGGEVNKPGLQTLHGEVNALQAVINASGFKETARLSHVIVIRKDKGGKTIPYKVNLSKAVYAANPQETFLLQPSDVVYVPKTAIANLDKFVDQYIAKLFLFRGIGVGFSYDLDNGTRIDIN
ncbi:MAG: polysaccharide biosynthesis/export family protein [Desulfobacteraceae bacterium]|nr:polysaccharide biosynthesis/export family protein [Desulfobacteraceae bacterium]